MAFTFEETKIPGLVVISPKVYIDERGYFAETYTEREFELNGVPTHFVQDNESLSSKGVLRGLHFQKEHTQGKLVRVTEGIVFDVAVDLRPSSQTFGKWVGVVLDATSKRMFYIPEGFAHGFLVMSDFAKFNYKCTDYYCKSAEGGIPWNDPAIGIQWPKIDKEYILSDKDKNYLEFMQQDFSWADK